MVLSIPTTQEQIRSFEDPNRRNFRILHSLIRVLDWPDNVPLGSEGEGACCQENIRFSRHW